MSAGGRDEERRKLADIIHHWNANRLDLFEISQPTEVSAAAGVRGEGGARGPATRRPRAAECGGVPRPPLPRRPACRPRTRPRPRPCPLGLRPPCWPAGSLGALVLVASCRAPPPGRGPGRLGGPRGGRAGHLRAGTHLDVHLCVRGPGLATHVCPQTPPVSPRPFPGTHLCPRARPAPTGRHRAAHLCPHDPPVPRGPHPAAHRAPHAAPAGLRAFRCGVRSPPPVSLMASS